MIDESDANFSLLLFGGTPIGLIIAILIAYQACQNKEDCSKRHCDKGHPVLTAHECLCLEEAK
jgi:hypothetical protein